MNGSTHQLVANLSLACLTMDERHILYPRWGGIESGATLSDDFRIMWEPESIGLPRQLVHRYFVDSENPKDHGCVTRAWDHATGCISFIEDFLAGKLKGSYSEDEFLENLGMFLGIASHHIADLCTPVHVGHKMDYSKVGSESPSRFHSQVERDITRFTPKASITLCKPHEVSLSKKYFQKLAVDSYEQTFLLLEDIYASEDQNRKVEMTSLIISNGVKHTADVWHTVLVSSGMLKRTWSMHPLL
jgi:hypothetical protein